MAAPYTSSLQSLEFLASQRDAPPDVLYLVKTFQNPYTLRVDVQPLAVASLLGCNVWNVFIKYCTGLGAQPPSAGVWERSPSGAEGSRGAAHQMSRESEGRSSPTSRGSRGRNPLGCMGSWSAARPLGKSTVLNLKAYSHYSAEKMGSSNIEL